MFFFVTWKVWVFQKWLGPWACVQNARIIIRPCKWHVKLDQKNNNNKLFVIFFCIYWFIYILLPKNFDHVHNWWIIQTKLWMGSQEENSFDRIFNSIFIWSLISFNEDGRHKKTINSTSSTDLIFWKIFRNKLLVDKFFVATSLAT